MGEHKDKDKQDSGGTPGYDPKHSGGWDADEWARATADTQKIPKVEEDKKK